MRRYEKYKDSGIEWIGEVPEHWESIRLKYIGYLYGGLAGKSANDFNQESNFNNKPFIPFTNICNNKIIDPNQLQQVVIEETEQQNQVAQGDLFFMMSSENFDDVGKSSILLDDLGETFLNSFCKGFRFTNDKYYPPFVNYQLLSKAYRSLVLTEANGYTRINLKIDKINDIPLKTPPTLDEQIAIANYLDQKTAEIDELIKQKEKLFLLFEEDKTGIINNAVTKGINSEVKLKDSGIEWLGLIPEHWKVKRFKYLGKFINGFSFNSSDFVNSGIRVIKISNIQTMTLDWSDESFVEDVFYDNYPSFRVYENDLVFALTRPIISTGIKAAIVNSSEKLLLNQRNSMFRVIEAVNTRWMYYLVLSNNFIQEFDKQIDKTGQQPNISSNDIAEIFVPVPEIEEQLSVIHYLDNECQRIDEIKNKIKIQIEVFKEYKTALISEVATGKIKVI